MKTAKSFQLIDGQNNNLSPLVGVDSLYLEEQSGANIVRKAYSKTAPAYWNFDAARFDTSSNTDDVRLMSLTKGYKGQYIKVDATTGTFGDLIKNSNYLSTNINNINEKITKEIDDRKDVDTQLDNKLNNAKAKDLSLSLSNKTLSSRLTLTDNSIISGTSVTIPFLTDAEISTKINLAIQGVRDDMPTNTDTKYGLSYNSTYQQITLVEGGTNKTISLSLPTPTSGKTYGLSWNNTTRALSLVDGGTTSSVTIPGGDTSEFITEDKVDAVIKKKLLLSKSGTSISLKYDSTNLGTVTDEVGTSGGGDTNITYEFEASKLKLSKDDSNVVTLKYNGIDCGSFTDRGGETGTSCSCTIKTADNVHNVVNNALSLTNSGNTYTLKYNGSNKASFTILSADSVKDMIPTNMWDSTNHTNLVCGTKNGKINTSGVSLSGTNNDVVTADSYYANSDERLKKNISEVNDFENIPEIVEFDWKESGKHSAGMIAQKLEEQGYDWLVEEKENGYKAVNYEAGLSLIVAKLMNKIESLEKRIAELEKK